MSEQGISTSAARSVPQSNLARLSKKAGEPTSEQNQIAYGLIKEVDLETSQVKVQLYTNSGIPDIIIPGFHPLMNPLSEIHLLWGKLRRGLAVRVFYKGKDFPPESPIVEVIGDENLSFLKKDNDSNIIATGPYKMFSGGLLG